MAKEKQLKILRDGVKAWNGWREENPGVRPDLRRADLRDVKLRGVNFRGADLRRAVLRGANLSNADLRGANIRDADLLDADLLDADLTGAHLLGTELTGIDLSGANLRGANLRGANLRDANLRGTHLCGADFRGTRFAYTIVGFIDLREAKGLESVQHQGPSALSVDVLQKAQGQLPGVFLKGCGLADWEIEAAKLWNPDLSENERIDITDEIHRLQGEQPIQLNRLFISYAHADAAFLEQLEPQFDEEGIRYWRDVHDMTAGRVETQIDRALTLYPLVLLVLSEQSVESDWVEWEAKKARELEKKLGRDVLCPVALDDAWKSCSWPERLRAQIDEYNILDFSGWRDKATFERQFGKLLDGLSLFYKPKQL